MAEFRIVETGILLENHRPDHNPHAPNRGHFQPGAPIINGDVAELTDGRYMARTTRTSIRGDAFYGYRDWSPTHDDVKDVHRWEGRDYAYDLAAEIDQFPGKWSGLAWNDPGEVRQVHRDVARGVGPLGPCAGAGTVPEIQPGPGQSPVPARPSRR